MVRYRFENANVVPSRGLLILLPPGSCVTGKVDRANMVRLLFARSLLYIELARR